MAIGPKVWPGSHGLRDQIVEIDNRTAELELEIVNVPSSDQKAALEGTFGTPSSTNRYVTESDPILERYHTITVSPTGMYTSLKEAIDSITGASAIDQYAIYMAPGIYFEQAFSMKPYVSVIGKGGHGHSVTVAALDDYSDFITGSHSSSLTDIDILGPTQNGCAAVVYEDSNAVPFRIDNCIFLDGYYGIICNTATGNLQLTDVSTNNASPMQTFLQINAGNVLATNCIVSGGICQNGFEIIGSNSVLYITDSLYDANGINGIFIDNDAFAVLVSCAFNSGINGVHVGPAGSDTEIYIGSCFFLEDEFTWELLSDTDTCIISVSGGFMRRNLISIPDGTRFVASFVDDNHIADSGNVVRGELWCGPIAATIPLVSYTKSNGNTGVVQGGEVTRVSGLTVNISDGYGFIYDGRILQRVSWGSSNLTLSPNLPSVWIVCNTEGVFYESPYVTSPYNSISFAVGATDASNVTILGSRHVILAQPAPASFIYARDVVGPISVSGMAVTKHSSPSLQLDVDSGNFYIYDVPKTADAHSPITFTYWHHSASGGWTTTSGQTAINPDGYDAYNYTGSGSIQPVPAGKFKRDLIYLTTNGAGTEYHVIYGQQVYASAILALNNPNPPEAFNNIALRLAGIIVEQGASDISTVEDQRPKLGQLAATGTVITDHGSLSGLADNDHPQYQLKSEKNLANGFCGLDSSAQVATAQLPFAATPPQPVDRSAASVGSTNKLSKSDHKHDISTAAPANLAIGNTTNEGVATSLARSDHQHAISSGTPVSVSTTNTSGSAATFSRSDHVHSGLTRDAGDFSSFSHKSTPISTDVVLIEDSASGQTKAYATVGSISSSSIFGRDFTNSASEGASTTTNTTFQTKLTVTTGSLTGTYRIGCHAELIVTSGAASSRDISARLYNSTDSIELCAVQKRLVNLTTDRSCLDGFQYVTFSGLPKTFLIQFASPSGIATVSISRARIEIWRVS